ncbi:MAG: hypothetical protein GYA17_15545 [Chloroflexi bacterium]|nr:hypothetical protein [Chloroflexota bacterium]
MNVPPEPPQNQEKPPRPRRLVWVLAGIGCVLVMVAIGSFIGYQAGISNRLRVEADQVAMATTTQFQLGLQDLADGRYDIARQRFEYVIRLDPQFPGASEKLSEAMMSLAMVRTPTLGPTATPDVTATPDLRGVEELYSTAQQLLAAQQWQQAIDTLDALRFADATYRTVDVDGMYYIALRYRGVNKITLEGNLEGGMYDLALSERFAPLDGEANGYRTWARMYMSGASFWELDWQRVLEYFSQIYPVLPNLRDGSGWTAVDRYRLALIGYGDQLADRGDYCSAWDQYKTAQQISSDDTLNQKASGAEFECLGPTETPAPAATIAAPTSAGPAPTAVTPPPVVVTTEPPPVVTTEAPAPPDPVETTPPADGVVPAG